MCEADLDIRTVAFAPDGSFVVTGSWDNTTCVWQIIESDKPGAAGRHSPPLGSPMRKMAPIGHSVRASSPLQSGIARKLPAKPQSLISPLATPPGVGIGERKGSLVGQGPLEPPQHKNAPSLITKEHARMSRKNSSSSSMKDADLKSSASGKDKEHAHEYKCLVQHAHKNSVLSVGVCPHSKYVASTSADHTLVVYHITVGGVPPHAIEMWTGHHGSYVQSSDFSSSGKMLASVGGDRICRWSPA